MGCSSRIRIEGCVGFFQLPCLNYSFFSKSMPVNTPGSRCWATVMIGAVGQAEAVAEVVSSPGGMVTSSMYRPLRSSVMSSQTFRSCCDAALEGTCGGAALAVQRGTGSKSSAGLPPVKVVSKTTTVTSTPAAPGHRHSMCVWHPLYITQEGSCKDTRISKSKPSATPRSAEECMPKNHNTLSCNLDEKTRMWVYRVYHVTKCQQNPNTVCHTKVKILTCSRQSS
ncbi:uncharacterized protein LOC142557949 [Dermacentor variabilis]|uniref:uncharacterized protein LOC142557949 n=1 Tax=Dermacentor variabilis TaxID=34621 RepID=UPI003F5C7F64